MSNTPAVFALMPEMYFPFLLCLFWFYSCSFGGVLPLASM